VEEISKIFYLSILKIPNWAKQNNQRGRQFDIPVLVGGNVEFPLLMFSKCVTMCQNVSQCVKTCHNVSKRVTMSRFLQQLSKQFSTFSLI